mgnify:CR=1 FL=1
MMDPDHTLKALHDDLEALRVALNKESEKRKDGTKLTMLAFLGLVTYVPMISLWLPKTLGMM